MLIVVCEAYQDLDAQTFAHLPNRWTILHEIAQLQQCSDSDPSS